MATQDCVIIQVQRSPASGEQESKVQEYRIALGKDDKTSLLQGLEEIYQTQDDTLAFRRYCCGLQFCNSCMMRVNGKNTHACMIMLEPGKTYELGPLSGHTVVRDLVVEM